MPISDRIRTSFLYVFRLLGSVGGYGAGALSWAQYQTGDACPTVGIPVCYAIMGVFLVLTVGSFLMQHRSVRFVLSFFLVIGLGISGFATLSNIAEWRACPQTSQHVPMCYIALSLFGAMGLSWILSNARGFFR